MATLVFSTVGTILGGPVGGAIGALIGQSIDEQVLGSASRGPKLGDLGVQTSSYGTQVPRIYGSMRVAGSVVWSTDLVQSEQTSGAKGQPDVTYSYAVSFAVALSSRKAAAVGRIWADGKLLRGAEGDFKVATQFRFYDGGENQPIDPLIASIEGIDTTPAYRGLALAVFEGLELAEYGNRIPFLTFEVLADEEPPTIGVILGDCSGGAIECEVERTIAGYAAYGASMRAAIEPLVETFGVRLFDDGSVVRDAEAAVVPIDPEDFGYSLDREREPRMHREQGPASELPARLRLGFYDPARDYQSGEARASAGDEDGREARLELAAVLGADEAKGLAQQMLASAWAKRDRLTLRLPPAAMAIEPGAVVLLPMAPPKWTVERSVIEGFVPKLELRALAAETPLAAAADPGGIIAPPDVVASATVVALIDAPNVLDPAAEEPVIYLAASRSSPGWSARTVELVRGPSREVVLTARRKSVLGHALGVLGQAGPHLIDQSHSVEVELIDRDQWLTSCDDAALAEGRNLAALGRELIQFGSAEPVGEGRFRLSRLLRGRAGSEDFAGAHVAGETFVLIDRDTLVPVPLPAHALGGEISATPLTPGDMVESSISSASIRPPAPVALTAAGDGSGGLSVGWTRRSRKGWAWLDEIDAPLGESVERYRVRVSSAGGSVEAEVDSPTAPFEASALSALESGPWTISVRQLGEFAASVPTSISFDPQEL